MRSLETRVGDLEHDFKRIRKLFDEVRKGQANDFLDRVLRIANLSGEIRKLRERLDAIDSAKKAGEDEPKSRGMAEEAEEAISEKTAKWQKKMLAIWNEMSEKQQEEWEVCIRRAMDRSLPSRCKRPWPWWDYYTPLTVPQELIELQFDNVSAIQIGLLREIISGGVVVKEMGEMRRDDRYENSEGGR